ncbi:MAG: Fic family protein [Solirubrobacterales bacterium]
MAAIFAAPELGPLDREVLRLIDELRADLGSRSAERSEIGPRRWVVSLRRMALARAVQASNSIEGYNASLDDVVAAVDGEPTIEAGEETSLALSGYRDAMTYVMQVARDPDAEVDDGLIKALHFMMLKHDLAKSPGRWRGGWIGVRHEDSGELVYEGPPAQSIPELIGAMIWQLREADVSLPVLVRAAMAHLNLVMIHPFRDGNGRMARCLQTLVLAREGLVAPALSSIEEYLGHNTRAYYDVLAEVGGGKWSPQRDTGPWLRLCLTAHYRQAKTHLRRIEETERLWRECAAIAHARGLPERAVGGLMEAALGFRLRNPTYRSILASTAGEEVSELTAGRELKAMVDAGLLRALGERRARHYLAEQVLTDIQEQIRAERPPREDHDPYSKAQQELQLTLES